MTLRCPSARALAGPAALLFVAGCTYPATGVLVVVGTDVPPDVRLSVSVSAFQGGAPARTLGTQRWTRRAADAGASEGITLPASFGVVPAPGASREVPVTLVVEADAGGVLLRRRAQFAFVPNTTSVLRIFLTARCAERAEGCTSPGPCTVQRRCEERGETCGNEGGCVPVPTTLEGPDARDASFGDVPAAVCGLYGQACCSVGAACRGELSCVDGVCRRCTDPDEVCCDGGELAPDGTVCAAAPSACHRAGVCTAGVCGPVTEAPDGTECAPAADPRCQRPGVCTAGACGPVTNLADGTACGAPPDACHLAPRCAGGRCGAAPVAPDGAPAGGGQRCCGGRPTAVNTTSNCGACGLRCGAGQRCTQLRGEPQYYCTCSSSTDCFSGCCVTYYGAPWACGASRCAPGTCVTCPGGARCHESTTNPYWCGYD